MRALLLILAAVAVVGATSVQQVVSISWAYDLKKAGPGNVRVNASCADIGALDQTALHYWITGYFSGANIDGGRTVGAETSEDALVNDVKDACREIPSMPLTLVVKTIYERMQHKRN